MRDMTFIDDQLGVCLMTGGEGSDIEIKLYDSVIYGEPEDNSDCPSG